MKKRLFILFSVLIVVLLGCSHKKEKSRIIRVALLKGPSAIALYPLLDSRYRINGRALEVALYDNPEQVKALMIKEKADLVALPVATAANLYNKGLPYNYLGCPVWGNLFWVSRLEGDKPQPFPKIHLFGQGTTPDILLSYLLTKDSFSSVKNFSRSYVYDTPQAIVQGLLGETVTDAILPEPFVSMVLSRDSMLYIRYDLANSFSSRGFPQTALMLHERLKNEPEISEELNRLFEKLCTKVNHADDHLKGLMVLKRLIPDKSTAHDVISRCGIRYQPASNIYKEVGDLLNILYLYQPKAIGGKVPDIDFYILSKTGL